MAYKILKNSFYCQFAPEKCGYFNQELKLCETDSTIGICIFHPPEGFIKEIFSKLSYIEKNCHTM